LIGNIVEQHLFMKSGEFVKDFMTQKIGIIIFKFSSRNDYEKKSGLVKSPTHVEVQ
jgi:ribosomal protein L21